MAEKLTEELLGELLEAPSIDEFVEANGLGHRSQIGRAHV